MAFYHGGAAANSFSIAIDSLLFIMNFETSYVSLVDVVAVES